MVEEMVIDKNYPGVRVTEHGAYLDVSKTGLNGKRLTIDGVRVISYGLDQTLDSLHVLNGGSLFGKKAVIGELILRGNKSEVTFGSSLNIDRLSIRGSGLCSISGVKQIFVKSHLSVSDRSFFYFNGDFNLPERIEISNEANVSANNWIKNGQILDTAESKRLGLTICGPVRNYPSCEVD